MTTIEVPEKLLPIYGDKNQQILAHGGRDAAKSWFLGGMFLARLSQGKFDLLCVRQYQKDLTQSNYKLLKNLIERYNLPYSVYYNKIVSKITGSEIIFVGMNDQTNDNIKSYEGFHFAWVEEAQTFSRDSILLLTPTIIRGGKINPQIFYSMNRKFPNDPVWEYFKDLKENGEDASIYKINYTDNPFITEQTLKQIMALKKANYEDYVHTYLGEPRKQGLKHVISYENIEKALTSNKGEGLRVAALDVADDGKDKNAFIIKTGNTVDYIEVWDGLDIAQTADRAIRLCNEFDCRELIYDAIGVGAGIGAIINQKSRLIESMAYKASRKVDNPTSPYIDYARTTNDEMFENKKAQDWDNLNRSLQNNEIMIYNKLDCLNELTNELTQATRSENKRGRMIVDKIGTGTKSPNIADALVMINQHKKNNFNLDYDRDTQEVKW